MAGPFGERLKLPAAEEQMLPLVHHRAKSQKRHVSWVDRDGISRLEKSVQVLSGLSRHGGETYGL
jgi:hypothetical protein